MTYGAGTTALALNKKSSMPTTTTCIIFNDRIIPIGAPGMPR